MLWFMILCNFPSRFIECWCLLWLWSCNSIACNFVLEHYYFSSIQRIACTSRLLAEKHVATGQYDLNMGHYYLRQWGYAIVVVCLSVCLLATLRKNFWTDLREIFRELGWLWANEQMIKFWSDLDPNPDRNTGKTSLGGGMHCPSASCYGRPM